jgi:hypothetical protein
MPYEIRKDPSYYLKWQLWHDGTFVARFTTKREALLMKSICEGDLSAAPVWYRLCVAKAEKKFGNRCDALRSARFSAVSFNLSPEDVQADPATGEPYK